MITVNKSLCCDICHLAKQKHLPFQSSIHISIAPFDLLHSDLWGPFCVPTLEGYKFFLL